MRPTDDLRDEHKAVLVAISIIEGIAGKLERGQAVPKEHLEQVSEFLRGFVDKCHHGKEETALFPAMQAAGVPRDGGPIGAMLAEHETGRALVRQMAETGSFARTGRQYAALLRSHIEKENGVLFPLADKVLSGETQHRLEQEFERIEETVVGHGKHEQYHAMLRSLKALYAV